MSEQDRKIVLGATVKVCVGNEWTHGEVFSNDGPAYTVLMPNGRTLAFDGREVERRNPDAPRE